MLIDCDACAVRGPACDDCVVSVLLAGPAVHAYTEDSFVTPRDEAGVEAGLKAVPELDPAERAAIAVLAGCGLVPPLRLVPLEPPGPGGARAPDRPVGRRPGAAGDEAREVS